MKPTATFRFFRSDFTAAAISRRVLGASGANDFSMKTFTPFFTAYSNIIGRNAAWVVSSNSRPSECDSSYSGLPWSRTQSGTLEPAKDVLGCHAPKRLAHSIIEPRPRLHGDLA